MALFAQVNKIKITVVSTHAKRDHVMQFKVFNTTTKRASFIPHNGAFSLSPFQFFSFLIVSRHINSFSVL